MIADVINTSARPFPQVLLLSGVPVPRTLRRGSHPEQEPQLWRVQEQPATNKRNDYFITFVLPRSTLLDLGVQARIEKPSLTSKAVEVSSQAAVSTQTNWTTNWGTGACFHTDLLGTEKSQQQQHQLQTSSSTVIPQLNYFQARNILPWRLEGGPAVSRHSEQTTQTNANS